MANDINGTSGRDDIDMTRFRDHVKAGNGDDIIADTASFRFNGLDGDTIDGGEGNDSVFYIGAVYQSLVGQDEINIDLNRATQIGGPAAGDTLISIENIIGGTLGNDTVRGNDVDNILGEGQEARLAALNGFDSDAVINDGGNDLLDGRGGNDILAGGDGRDTLIGGSGQDTLFGDEGADNLDGGEGNDILNGGTGADVLKGGGNVDAASYSSSSAAVTVTLGEEIPIGPFGGTITVGGLASGGDAQGDSLSDIENLIGSGFADRLTGNTGSNLLSGGGGADTLTGGGGKDSLDGGVGSDTYVFTAKSDSFAFIGNAFDPDRILSFDDSGVFNDIIDLSGIDANELVAGNQAFFLDDGDGIVEIGELIINNFNDPGIGNQLVTSVFADVSGDGNADFGLAFASLINTLDGTDFIL